MIHIMHVWWITYGLFEVDLQWFPGFGTAYSLDSAWKFHFFWFHQNPRLKEKPGEGCPQHVGEEDGNWWGELWTLEKHRRRLWLASAPWWWIRMVVGVDELPCKPDREIPNIYSLKGFCTSFFDDYGYWNSSVQRILFVQDMSRDYK